MLGLELGKGGKGTLIRVGKRGPHLPSQLRRNERGSNKESRGGGGVPDQPERIGERNNPIESLSEAQLVTSRGLPPRGLFNQSNTTAQ